jgi:signal transduction histidine kinase
MAVMSIQRRASPEFPVRRWPERRVVVLVAATLLLIGVFVASMLSGVALDKLAVLYVLPVVLIGLELGMGSGIGAAAIAFGLLFAASGSHPELGTPGLAASGTVFLAAGAVAGRFSARMREAHRRWERLLASGLRLARLEDLDALPVVLAGELQEALDLSGLRVQLLGAPVVEIGGLPGETLPVPITTRGIDYGVLLLGSASGRSFTEEERVVAGKLALQAAVAADNQRLLASERERATLHAELEQTRQRLAGYLRNVGQILDDQEAERREIARHLHEEAAQAMGAVLLGLQMLDRDLDTELTRQQLEEVRSIARDTLTGLRQLAVAVRPASLDDLGLRAALEGMAEREAARRGRPITLDCDGCAHDLGAEVETCAYHLVEDAIRALAGSLEVQLSVDEDRGRLAIRVSSHDAGAPERLLARLATAHARLELIGGILEPTVNGSGPHGILAEVPLHRVALARERRQR